MKPTVLLCSVVLALMAAFVGLPAQAGCGNWLDRNWPRGAMHILSVRRNLVLLQEGVPIQKQKIAQTTKSDIELARKWLDRENRLEGLKGSRATEIVADAEFITTIPKWQDMTNLELRKFLAINSIEQIANSEQLEAHHLYAIQEITSELHLTPHDFAAWRKIFPHRPLPWHPMLE